MLILFDTNERCQPPSLTKDVYSILKRIFKIVQLQLKSVGSLWSFLNINWNQAKVIEIYFFIRRSLLVPVSTRSLGVRDYDLKPTHQFL